MTNPTDVSSNTSAPLPLTPPTAPKCKKSRKCIVGLIFLLLIIIAGWASVFCYLRYYEAPKQLQLNKQIATLQMTWIKTQAQVAHQDHSINLIEQSLKQFHKANWPLAQAQYLVKLASFNLTFDNNIPLAAQILKSADSQLQATNDPSLWPIREAIASDVSSLNAIEPVDMGGIISTLNAISEQVEKFPQAPVVKSNTPELDNVPVKPSGPSSYPNAAIPGGFPGAGVPQLLPVNNTKSTSGGFTGASATTLPGSSTPQNTASSTHPYITAVASWFGQLGENVWRILKTMIVVHHNVPNAEPLLPAEQYVYVITNIQAKLALAQWAVIHQNPEVFSQNLTLAATWIKRYFAISNPGVNAAILQLDALSKLNIKPNVPDLSHSLTAISQAMEK